MWPAMLPHAASPAVLPSSPATSGPEETDAIRGLAALVVLLHHCWQCVLPDQNTFPWFSAAGGPPPTAGAPLLATIIASTPLRLLFSGHAAVGLFFVLSGFVLTQSLRGSRHRDYVTFAVRRICRIWLPFVVVIVVAAGLRLMIDSRPIAGMDWLNQSWNTPVNGRLILGHAAMLGTTTYQNLDNPMWSLVHEMRISLIFPLLLLATVARPRLAVLLTSAIFAAFSSRYTMNLLKSLWGDQLPGEIAVSLTQTARYGIFFVFGIVLAANVTKTQAVLGSSPKLRAALWASAAALLCIPYSKGYFDYAYALGALALLAVCISSPTAARWLRRPTLQGLGKISYSLYLVHLVVILSLVHLLHEWMPTYAILAIAIPAAVMTAMLAYRLVESPCRDLGRSFTRRTIPSQPTRAWHEPAARSTPPDPESQASNRSAVRP